jgi:CRISPR-associated protein Csb1
MSELESVLDAWADGHAAALVLEQRLRPVVGTLVFPPTFAPVRRGEPSDYVLDEIDGLYVVTLDTPGAQANRLEPLFMQDPLAALVPQITIIAGNQQKNLLELGHRAADALARSAHGLTDIDEA